MCSYIRVFAFYESFLFCVSPLFISGKVCLEKNNLLQIFFMCLPISHMLFFQKNMKTKFIFIIKNFLDRRRKKVLYFLLDFDRKQEIVIF